MHPRSLLLIDESDDHFGVEDFHCAGLQNFLDRHAAMLHFFSLNAAPTLIGLDCRFASTLGGLGTYTRSLTEALLRRDDPWTYVLFVPRGAETWLSSLPFPHRFKVVLAPYGHYSIAEQFLFSRLLSRQSLSLLYAPHFNVPFFCPVPFVCTVHDLILHRFPLEAGLVKRLAYRLVFGRAVSRARAVSVVSRATLDELEREHPLLRGRLTIVSPAVDSSFVRASDPAVAEVRRRYGLVRPYLLYIGNCKIHKNVFALLSAFTQSQLEGVDLVLVTNGRECRSLLLPAHARIISGAEKLECIALLSGALAMVSATLAEGFGLPMLEAMSCQCPVLATNCGAVPEVCRGHALLVEPTVDALSNGMKQIATDPRYRSPEWLQAAYNRSRQFSWDESASVLVSLFSANLIPSSLPHRVR